MNSRRLTIKNPDLGIISSNPSDGECEMFRTSDAVSWSLSLLSEAAGDSEASAPPGGSLDGDPDAGTDGRADESEAQPCSGSPLHGCSARRTLRESATSARSLMAAARGASPTNSTREKREEERVALEDERAGEVSGWK